MYYYHEINKTCIHICDYIALLGLQEWYKYVCMSASVSLT